MSININTTEMNSAMDSRRIFNQNTVAKKATVIEDKKTEESQDIEQKTESSPVQTGLPKELRYNINAELDQVVVSVIDSNTNKVIKEIPSAQIQIMKERVKDVLGNFINETR